MFRLSSFSPYMLCFYTLNEAFRSFITIQKEALGPTINFVDKEAENDGFKVPTKVEMRRQSHEAALFFKF